MYHYGKSQPTEHNVVNQKGPVLYFDRAGFTPETLMDKINEYFNTMEPETITYMVQGKPHTKTIKLFTFPGLCIYIGLESRQRYWDIMRNTENKYSLPLKKGYIRIQNLLEKQAFLMPNPSGPIFILKNMHYSDNQVIDQRSSDGSMSPKPTIINHSKEEDNKKPMQEINKLIKNVSVEIEKN